MGFFCASCYICLQMQITTKAIVLSSLKFGDTSLIVKCFTLEAGLKSYMLKGVLKAKKAKVKAAYFQPLSQLEIEATHKNKGTLENIREVRTAYAYQSLHTDVKKSSVAMFLAEMLSTSIQEEEQNEGMFRYLETSLQWLDTHREIANFHMLFLLNLTRFLGFYPDTTNSHYDSFSLLEGAYVPGNGSKHIIYNEKLILLNRLLGTTFDGLHTVGFSAVNRMALLEVLIEYFELHLQGFKKPRSLSILNEVFR